MRAVTARYREHLKRSHQLAVRIDVTDKSGGVVASTHEVGDLPKLSVIGGQVRVARSTRLRRALTVEVAGDNAEVIPGAVDDIFSIVSGNQIRPYVGIRFPDGAEELFAQGVFSIDRADVVDRPDAFSVSIDGSDGSRRLIRDKFESAHVVDAGRNVVEAAMAIVMLGFIGSKIPDFRVTSTSHVTPQMAWDEDVERLKAVEDLMFSIGYECFFDANGYCVMQPQPNVADLLLPFSDVIYVEGATPDFDEDFYPLLGIEASSDNEDVVNRVVVVGESTGGGPPVRGVAIDDNPASRTYYYGPYGKVSTTIRTPAVASVSQATAAALGELRRRSMPTRTVQLETIANAAHEETDLIAVIRERSKVFDFFVVDGFVVPFTVDQPMVLTTYPRTFA